MFLHLSHSNLVFFKGDLNHRKLTYDCTAPASTPFEVAIGSMASKVGAPKICSLRTIKSDVVVGLGESGDEIAKRLDTEEPGWKISGKYVSSMGPRHSYFSHADTLMKGCGAPVVWQPWRESGPLLNVVEQVQYFPVYDRRS